jgi:hypothetical protein
MKSKAGLLLHAICLLIILECSCAAEKSGEGRKPFLPKAIVDVKVPQTQTSAFILLISTFANLKHLKLQRGDFPKSDRTVFNIQITITEESFFLLNNFVDFETFNVAAYSNEDNIVWRDLWTELISKITEDFGHESVIQKAIRRQRRDLFYHSGGAAVPRETPAAASDARLVQAARP